MCDGALSMCDGALSMCDGALSMYLQTARSRSVAMPMIRKVVQDIRMFFRGYQKYGNMYTYV